MSAENKKKIIDNLFDNQFNKDNFKEFVNTILNVKIDIDSEYKYVGIHKVFMNYIENYYIVSNYKDNEKNNILIMVVKIKDSIDDPVRARVKQREFIARHLRDKEKNGALVVFYNDKSKNWRISFIRLSYDFTSKGAEEKLTPAKRLSYVIGEGEASKTVKDQFFSLANMEESISLEQLEGLFALEKVTNEFFKEYKNKYLDIKETLIKDENFVKEALKHDIENPESFIEGFSKKLMGQIAFIYFLQKKGWLGIEIVPESLTFEEYNRIYERALDTEREVLNKVYFRKEKELYTLNKEELKKLDNKNESELLVGAFHNTEYFKEWGSGKKKFLRELFEKHKIEDKNNKKTFFEDYLEPLFYNNFSEDRGEKQYSAEFNCRLPFLNGGLFDPYGDYNWKETTFNLDDSLFSNDKDNGILDIFDRYNFTINENDNYETEVAVDPEMLGKVFENLLEVFDRKSKGAFYTPREIVRYMTNESIMNYLLSHLEEKGISKEDLEYLFNLGEFTKEYDEQIFEKDYITDKKELKKGIFGMPSNIISHSKEIDELLRKVKIADPACGSGAFPLGILNEIVRARNVLTFYINMIEILKEKDEKNYWSRLEKKQRSRTPYKLKLYAIQNSLYGVDIEPSAIDITKLRLWLSILVDSTNNDVRPLPNLDFNFMIGNSLIDEFEGMKLFDESLLDDKVLEKKLKKIKKAENMKLFRGIEDILKEIFIKQSLFFNENNSNKKKELKNDIEELENNLIKLTLTENGNHKKLEEIEKGRKERRKPYFLWKLEFAKVFKENGGFDIVIGNPPYIGEGKNKDVFLPVQQTSFGKKYYIGKMDFWYFFTSLGIELLKENGTLSYIAPNNWLTTAGGKKMRNHIMKETIIKEFIDFGDYMVFENASQQTMVFLLEKNKEKNIIKICFSKILFNKEVLVDLEKFLLKNKSDNYVYYISNIDRKKYIEDSNIVFLNNIIDTITSKIKLQENFKFLADEITNGIHPHHAIVTKKMLEQLKNNYKIGDGIFVLTDNEIKKLSLNENEKKLLKPLYESELLTKYTYKKDNHKYIIYTDSSFKDISQMKEYPILKKHLDNFKEVITSDNKPYGLHRARKEEFFIENKIVSLRKTSEPYFCYLDKPSYFMAEFYILKTDRINMKYLTGLLNSKLVAFWLRYMGKMQGSNYQIDKEPLMNIPIKIADENIENKIIDLVDEIIELKKLNKDTQDLEEKIDEMLYDLYGLTEDEKELIRNFK
ncbi:Eco57I restriction-modification methylase domain-containing protein [Fusobacterium polymorphum]|uniref:site-specific DNA-methyltransferase (adenine-specific) n=1 Tax=Fusobacterium nucleatum subsp. polymorphum TaxID=76857 RepID=A0A2C6B3H9_FUSNP|nr:Eco57I restriction-modification methylase domain-containing protein [Fusobacterium polymorphum]PHH98812.1 type II restriction endonuclease [Fusobacterium polymorphum]PIM76362.1 type II restriction endonuclease [Fusobacterium polymorphum]